MFYIQWFTILLDCQLNNMLFRRVYILRLPTKDNTERYRKQLDQIGFSYDWSREVQTSDPSYYKWTQWIFKQLFNSYYCKKEDKLCQF